jgi:hypothetical protein
LIAVNAANSIAALLHNLTYLFAAPFAISTSAPAVGGMVLEISTFILIEIY